MSLKVFVAPIRKGKDLTCKLQKKKNRKTYPKLGKIISFIGRASLPNAIDFKFSASLCDKKLWHLCFFAKYIFFQISKFAVVVLEIELVYKLYTT